MPVPAARLLKIIEVQNEIASSGLDADAAMAHITGSAQQLTGATFAVVELAHGSEMVYAHATGTAGAHVGLRLGLHSSLSGLCVTTGEILRCDDTEDDDRVDVEACRRIGARAMICVPLRHDGVVVGALKVAAPRPSAFSEEDIETLALCSQAIAAHLANAQTFSRLQSESLHDAVTGLANRRAYDARLAGEVNRCSRYGLRLSVVLLDLDDFKAVNDTYGHPAGDQALRDVADVIALTVRAADEPFRLGGDEFAIVMPNTTLGQARKGASRVAAAIDASGAGHGLITTSCGAAELGEETAESLHARADQELYEHKRRRRAQP